MPKGIDHTNSRGLQLFSVPCDAEGREFLRLLSKYANRRDWQLRKRGRGPRGVQRAHDGRVIYVDLCHIPVEMAEWFAVYARRTTPTTIEQRLQRALDVALSDYRASCKLLQQANARVRALEEALIRLTADALAVCNRIDL